MTKRVAVVLAIAATASVLMAPAASADSIQADINTVQFVSPFDPSAFLPGNMTPLLLSPFDTREVRCGVYQAQYNCVQYDNQGNFHMMTFIIGAPYREFWISSPI